jgi:hypothetical protein
MNWLSLVLKVAEKVIPLIKGIPPVLIPLIVEAIQLAERAGADQGLDGAAKKQLALQTIFGHTDEPAIGEVNVPLVSDAIDVIVKKTNAGSKVRSSKDGE